MNVTSKITPALLVAIFTMRVFIPMVSPGIIWVSAQTVVPTTFGPTPSYYSSGPTASTPDPTKSPTPAPTTPEPTKSPTPAPVPTVPTGTTSNECTKNPKKPKDLLTVKVKTGKQTKQNILTVKAKKITDKAESSAKVLYKKKFVKNEENEINACIKTKKFCYEFSMTDKQSNGLKNGYVQMFLNGDLFYEDDFIDGSEIITSFGNCS